MMIVLHPTYTFTVTAQDIHCRDINSPKQQFYNGLSGKTGCDDLLVAIRTALKAANLGVKFDVQLKRFEHRSEAYRGEE